MKKNLLAFTVFSLIYNGGVCARSTSHEIHNHGAGRMTVAIEEGAVQVHLTSPAVNFLGFEYSPTSQSEVDSVVASKAVLSSPENVLSIQGSNCSISRVQVSVLGPAGRPRVTQEHHDQEHHDQEHHDQEHHGDGREPNEHSEIAAEYLFSCTDNQVPDSVNVHLFARFPGLQKIEVNWVSESGQGAGILLPKSSSIEFR
ncbi:hypothetical protein NBRC116583_11730 [Arenicella sp. 4NH20-0111]|uniref:ZrgA family zinc uptake protein n=1 Tax=Arenicella sp. 4NH20-0111 TaxID=3127648 RepID=UPI0031064C43